MKPEDLNEHIIDLTFAAFIVTMMFLGLVNAVMMAH